MSNSTPQYLTLDEAADRLAIQPSTLARYCRDGIIPAVRLPGARGQFRIAEPDLILLLRPAVERRDPPR